MAGATPLDIMGIVRELAVIAVGAIVPIIGIPVPGRETGRSEVNRGGVRCEILKQDEKGKNLVVQKAMVLRVHGRKKHDAFLELDMCL